MKHPDWVLFLFSCKEGSAAHIQGNKDTNQGKVTRIKGDGGELSY